jgi:hypothetical protein
MAEVDGLFSALSYPQRALKEAISGDELSWGEKPDWMPHELYAGLSVAGDLVADPLNLLPIGLLGKGAKAAKGAFAPGASIKGLPTASTGNYIPNFYGLTDGDATKLSKLEGMMTPAIQKAAGMDFKSALGAQRKAKGFSSWLASGVGNAAKNVASPHARALHKEASINPTIQKDIAKYINKPNASVRDLEKASADVNYALHNRAQSGSVNPVAPAAADIAQKSNLETYTDTQPGLISDLMKKHSGDMEGTTAKFTDADAKYIEDHITKAWGGSDITTMKYARAPGTGGNHFTDMYAGRNPMSRPRQGNGVAQNAAKAMKEHGDNWLDAMPKNGSNYEIVASAGDDAVWIKSRGRNVGTAVTEGGVNWLMKLDKDGNMMSVISDKHDFLEKVPVFGKAVDLELPKKLVAVTPPMWSNVKNVMQKQLKMDTVPVPEGVKRIKKGVDTPNKKLLQDIVDLKPSAEGVRAEQLTQAGMLSGFGLGAAKAMGDNE